MSPLAITNKARRIPVPSTSCEGLGNFRGVGSRIAAEIYKARFAPAGLKRA
jgi:hypothetical protein